jgi:hypothetical protein
MFGRRDLPEKIVWAAALVIAVTVFLLIFRKSIAGLIDRTSRAGYGNKSIEFALPTNTAEQQKKAATPTDAEVSVATVPAQAVAPPPASEAYAGIEKQIFDTLNTENYPRDLERAWLVRAITIARVWRAHEITYRLILGSQLNLLLAANSLTPPEVNAARAVYDSAKAAFPAVFENFSFDTWLNWPINSGLIKMDQTNPARSIVRITPLGQDFLHYLVSNSLTANKAG